jgi:ABC-2 type transport system permease protein
MNRFIDIKQLGILIGAHLKEIIREPAVIFWGILFPMVMALGLGFAFTKKQNVVHKVAVVRNGSSVEDQNSLLDKTNTIYYNDSLKLFTNDSLNYSFTIYNEKLGDTRFDFNVMTWNNAIAYLKQGKANLIVRISGDSVTYHFDPLNRDAQIVYMKLSQLTSSGNLAAFQNSVNILPLKLPGSRYIDFLIPGLISMGVMMSTMWGLSYGMIEKRSKKLLRRMIATPMKKSHFLFSLLTVRLLMNIFEAILLTIFAQIVFKTHIQGSIPALILIFIAGNIAFAGIAIFLSSRTSKTEVGNGLVNMVVMPMMLLSGIFFSYHNFPDSFVAIIQKLPLTMVTDGIRSIFIEGAGFAQTLMPTLILFSIGIVFFMTGLRIFKWY